MRAKYDKFYASSLGQETLERINIFGWPKNRFEAALSSAPDRGDVILDVGCGNGFLLYQFKDSFTRLIGLEYSPHRLAQAEVNLRLLLSQMKVWGGHTVRRRSPALLYLPFFEIGS